MRSADTVLTAKTTERLEDLIPKLNKVSGLPVVDVNNRVIGVISRKVSCGCTASAIKRLQRIM
jgi:CBS-domain-containing membrane protein